MRQTKILFILIALLVAGGIVRAQAQDYTGLSVEINPENPGAYTPVTIKITDYSTDLRKADIKWYLNGKLVDRGAGHVSFSFTTAATGELTTVRADVSPSEGGFITRTINFRPASVDILWQADSYVPPLYAGKPLPTNNSQITLYALPVFVYDGKRLSPDNLMYEWSIDFEADNDQSGLGRKSMTMNAADFLSHNNIIVTVSTLDGKITGKGVLEINPISPQVLLFKNDSVTGIDYTQPLGVSATLTDKELTLKAEPFFFPESHKLDKGLLYKWALNGKEAVTDSGDPSSITLRTESGEGAANLTLNVQDPFDSFIADAKSLAIQFGGAAFK